MSLGSGSGGSQRNEVEYTGAQKAMQQMLLDMTNDLWKSTGGLGEFGKQRSDLFMSPEEKGLGGMWSNALNNVNWQAPGYGDWRSQTMQGIMGNQGGMASPGVQGGGPTNVGNVNTSGMANQGVMGPPTGIQGIGSSDMAFSPVQGPATGVQGIGPATGGPAVMGPPTGQQGVYGQGSGSLPPDMAMASGSGGGAPMGVPKQDLNSQYGQVGNEIARARDAALNWQSGMYNTARGDINMGAEQAQKAARDMISNVTAPALGQQATATGGSIDSGAYLESLSNAGMQAALPIMQQQNQNMSNLNLGTMGYLNDINNLFSGQTGNLGSQLMGQTGDINRQIQDQLFQFNMAGPGMAQGLAQGQMDFLNNRYGRQMDILGMGRDAEMQDYMRRQNLMQTALGLVPSAAFQPSGQTTRFSQKQSPGMLDYISALSGLAGAGMMGYGMMK